MYFSSADGTWISCFFRFLFLSLGLLPALIVAAEDRPNILWITCEDMSANLGCYGDPLAKTPHLDRFAEQSVLYRHAYSVAGVCAPSRSCIITGMYPTSLGSQHMRCRVTLPDYVRGFPEYLRRAGYYCTNNSKEDYNFEKPPETWDESSRDAHWRNRPADQPFFAVFNFTGTHESRIRQGEESFQAATSRLTEDQRHSPDDVRVPPYHPDTPAVRRDWARYHDLISGLDYWVADLLEELEQDGLADDTIVFFYSDHGVGLPRGKRWVYDSGIHIPLIIRFPEKYHDWAPAAPSSMLDRLVSFVDFGPTVLSLAGVEIPEHIQGLPFLGEFEAEPRDYIFAARDRMDERTDMTRAVRDQRYKYIRNYMPHLPYAQPIAYMNEMPTTQELRRLAGEGHLLGTAGQFMQPTKPREELYDTKTDPHEVHNLADHPNYQDVLYRLREAHHAWRERTMDLAFLPEAEILERAKGKAPYDVLHAGDAAYPQEKIFQSAVLVGQGPGAVAQQLRLMRDADSAVRVWAAIGLGVSQDARQEVVTALKQHLEDANASVQVASAEALARLRHPDLAIPKLCQLLEHENPWIRHSAALALDRMDATAAAAEDALRGVLHDSNNYVVRTVQHALPILENSRP